MKTTIKSINYFIKIWYKTDFKSLIWSFLQIIVLVVNPIVIAYIPKIMIECSESYNIKSSILIILCFVFVSVLLNWFKSSSAEMNKEAIYKIQNSFQLKLLDITEQKDYCILEESGYKDKIIRTYDFLSSGGFDSIGTVPQTLVNFISNCLGIFAYVIIFSRLNCFLIIIIVISVLLDLNVLKFSRKQRLIMKEKNTKLFRIFNAISDAAKNSKCAKEIRIFNFSKWFVDYNNSLSTQYKSNVNCYDKNTAKITFIRLIIALIRNGTLLTSLIISTINKNLSSSDFIFYFGLILGFSNWILGVSQNYNVLNVLSAELIKLKDLLKSSNNKINNTNSEINRLLNSEQITIEFKNVSFKYPNSSNYVLKNLNFVLKTNEKIALVGNNGAGKTTLIKLLCGFYTPTEGDILFNGTSITKIKSSSKFFELFSAVFQNSVLLPEDIYHNITCGNEQKRIDFESVVQLAGFDKTIASLPYKEKTKLIKELNDNAVDLSGGEQQKVLLSRAIYKNAKILLLDEPSSALDPISEENLYNSYSNISSNKLSVFVSHRLSSTKFCNRIFFIHNKTIQHIGTHEELMNKCKQYRNMFYAQSDYYKENLYENSTITV